MNKERTILIIDDDADFQLMVAAVLRNNGFGVRSLSEGIVDLALHLARDCDVILLDIDLPGVSGVELGKELKSSSETFEIPILLLSANIECDRLSVEARANAFLTKPFSIALLMDKIRGLMYSEHAA
jgi:two-component system, OmpR family, phosphate regulon response regulator PhoB